MSTDADVFKNAPGGRRERPWLLASNRKLRHLQGISIRNLAISPTANRVRGKTIDDENLPYTLKSPAKLLAQSEGRGLQHSRSSTDLSDLSSPKSASLKTTNVGSVQAEMPGARPAFPKLRRRSTLQWTGASPRARQKRLEDVAGGRMVDTWFSLHCQDIEEPVYISEVVEKAMNPSFRFFDLNSLGPLVTRLDEMTVRFWAKQQASGDYTLLVELQVNLRSLQFIGKSLENFRHPLPSNCMIFHLTDGIYTSFTDLPPSEPPLSFSLSKSAKSQDAPEPTSSYDALMRLANLDDCIQDALTTREKLESQINSILSSSHNSLRSLTSSSIGQEALSATKRSLTTERKHLRVTAKRREDLKASLVSRREAMDAGRHLQSLAHTHLSSAQAKLQQSHALLSHSREDARAQIRRICEDLLSIYPLEPIPSKPLSFTIRGLHLPNSSSFSHSDPETIAASLGYVSQVVYLLSFYLSIPLPFPIKPFSSRSFIQDPIASTIPTTQRIYPLYPGVQFRFDYGVFLLNKDIEFLLGREGLRILDPRQTLPNLKYLLYVLTAGTGELPRRKAGGVRGLLTDRGTPNLSRAGSMDSFVSDGFGVPARIEGTTAGKGEGMNGKDSAKNYFPPISSGLREAN